MKATLVKVGSNRQVIVHLVPSLHVGGVNKALAANVGALCDARFDHVVVSINRTLTLAPDFEDLGVPVISLEHTGLLTTARTFGRLRRLVRERAASIIHSHLGFADTYAAAVGRTCRITNVATLHNTDVKPMNAGRMPTTWLGRQVNRRGIDHFIAVSRSVRNAYARKGSVLAERIAVIYNGVGANAFQAPTKVEIDAARRELGLGPRTRVLLNVGRLVPEKNQSFLVPVMRLVLDANPDVVLLIAGSGVLHASLTKAVGEAGLQNRIRLLGRRSDVRTLLHMADAVLIPSMNEGFSMAAVEAMAAGRPIVGSEIPPLAEAIRNGVDGVLVRNPVPRSFADAVIGVLESPEQAKALGASARQRAAESFSTEHTSEQLAELYTRVGV